MIRTRFAPSPNGPLHLGHAFAALVAHDLARDRDGQFILRIEDIDGPRSQLEFAENFIADLDWLGLTHDGPAVFQSARLETYRQSAERLKQGDLLYPCQCTRQQIAEAATAMGPDGPVYPGTCKGRNVDPQGAAWRLDVERAEKITGSLEWEDEIAGMQLAEPGMFGDVVLVRRDLPASYHLAATLDDAADGITLVARGRDLFAATHIHRLLQALLDLPVPRWHHHGLLADEDGAKLAKRKGSSSLADLRQAGANGRELADALRAHRFPAGISLAKV